MTEPHGDEEPNDPGAARESNEPRDQITSPTEGMTEVAGV